MVLYSESVMCNTFHGGSAQLQSGLKEDRDSVLRQSESFDYISHYTPHSSGKWQCMRREQIGHLRVVGKYTSPSRWSEEGGQEGVTSFGSEVVN